uniref:RRP15-like protein n=1 Tax=Cebus imitator TaxID=2715852 RepID=A0A2K5QDE6_CEBIM
MAAALLDSRVSAEENLKKTPKKMMKMATRAVTSVVEEEGRDASHSKGSCGSEYDYFYSDEEAVEADSEGDAESCDEENEDDAESNIGTNASWADAMAKVLKKKTPESKSTILVKNKKLEKEKEKLKQERQEKIKEHDNRMEWEMMCRVKQGDRNLQRIAMRGVVQLFNAVQKHQKNVDVKVKEAGSSIRKRTKLITTVSKKDFISQKKPKAKQTEVKSAEGPGWTILSDDFMMGASMKDWNKESDGPDDSRPESASDSYALSTIGNKIIIILFSLEKFFIP